MIPKNSLVWVCLECRKVFKQDYEGKEHMDFANYPYPVTCIKTEQTPYLPLSTHQEALRVAVETLEVIKSRSNAIQMDDIVSQVFSINNIAEECLLKLKESSL